MTIFRYIRQRFRLEPRFRLRTFFLLVTALGVLFGTVGVRYYQRYRQESALAAIREVGGLTVTNEHGQVARVYLRGAKFDDNTVRTLAPHLQVLPNLAELDLVASPVTDEGLSSLSRLDQLKELYLFETQVSDAGRAALQRELPYLAIKLEEPDPIASSKVGIKIYRHAVITMAVHNDGEPWVSGSGDGSLRWFRGAVDGRPRKVAAHSDWLFSTAFSPDGTLLATGGGDNLIKLWDSESLRPVAMYDDHRDDVHAVVFSTDGRKLFSAGDDMSIHSVDVRSGRRPVILGYHEEQIPCLAVHPDGRLLASGSRDNTIGLWDTSKGVLLRTLKGHTDDVMSVTFLADGTLVSASYDKTVRLWDPDSGTEIGVLLGHARRVYTVAASHDGRTLASGGEDGVILWDRGRLEPRVRLRQLENISTVRFGPDDRQLIVADASGDIRFLDVANGAPIRRISTSRAARPI